MSKASRRLHTRYRISKWLDDAYGLHRAPSIWWIDYVWSMLTYNIMTMKKLYQFIVAINSKLCVQITEVLLYENFFVVAWCISFLEKTLCSVQRVHRLTFYISLSLHVLLSRLPLYLLLGLLLCTQR